MRAKFLFILAVCCSFVVSASPGLADEVKADAAGLAVVMSAPAACNALSLGVPPPLFMTCTVQIECDTGSVISCSGNSCSTGGASNNCVVCNGNQMGCCPGLTCCQKCAAEREDCFLNCPDSRHCNYCNTAYNICVSGCTGGCS